MLINKHTDGYNNSSNNVTYYTLGDSLVNVLDNYDQIKKYRQGDLSTSFANPIGANVQDDYPKIPSGFEPGEEAEEINTFVSDSRSTDINFILNEAIYRESEIHSFTISNGIEMYTPKIIRERTHIEGQGKDDSLLFCYSISTEFLKTGRVSPIGGGSSKDGLKYVPDTNGYFEEGTDPLVAPNFNYIANSQYSLSPGNINDNTPFFNGSIPEDWTGFNWVDISNYNKAYPFGASAIRGGDGGVPSYWLSVENGRNPYVYSTYSALHVEAGDDYYRVGSNSKPILQEVTSKDNVFVRNYKKGKTLLYLPSRLLLHIDKTDFQISSNPKLIEVTVDSYSPEDETTPRYLYFKYRPHIYGNYVNLNCGENTLVYNTIAFEVSTDDAEGVSKLKEFKEFYESNLDNLDQVAEKYEQLKASLGERGKENDVMVGEIVTGRRKGKLYIKTSTLATLLETNLPTDEDTMWVKQGLPEGSSVTGNLNYRRMGNTVRVQISNDGVDTFSLKEPTSSNLVSLGINLPSGFRPETNVSYLVINETTLDNFGILEISKDGGINIKTNKGEQGAGPLKCTEISFTTSDPWPTKSI